MRLVVAIRADARHNTDRETNIIVDLSHPHAIAAGEIPPPEYAGTEEQFALAGGDGLSPAVLAAEEVLDGRVRVPKLKRKPGELRPRGRKPEEGDEPLPPTA